MKFTLVLVSALVMQAFANPVPDADASRRDVEVSFFSRAFSASRLIMFSEGESTS